MGFRDRSHGMERLSNSDDLGRVAELFGLVADTTRAGVLYALSESKELTLLALVTAVDASEDAVAGAVRVLRGADIIRSRRRHGVTVYSLRDADVAHLLRTAAASQQMVPVSPARRRTGPRLSVRR